MAFPKLFITIFVLIAVGWLSIFTVDERQRAIKFRLGSIERSDYKPGLHFQIPFINNVGKFDARVLTLDSEPERFLTSEKKDVIVDSYVKWRINDVEKYYKATGGDERRTALLLFQKINDGLRSEFGKRTILEVVSGERGAIMDIVTQNANRQATELGVSILDVRIQRIDLPEEVSSSVYQRMRAERERVARDFRSRGAEAAERIRADADRERTVILAEAYRDAEGIRGEGDAKAADTYAKSFGKNQEFYQLTRSLKAYKKSMGKSGDLLLLEPDSDFFRYFKDPLGH